MDADSIREAAMGFLAICSHTDCNGESAMRFLAICSPVSYTHLTLPTTPYV